jgi:hypothetical protein
MAASAMTETIMPPEMLANLKVTNTHDCMMHVVSHHNVRSLNLSHLSLRLFAIQTVLMLLGERLKSVLGSSLKYGGSAAMAPFSRRMLALHHQL